MKLLVLKDKLITESELQELYQQISDLYKKHTSMVPVFFTEETDFSDYPTEIDGDGDVRISKPYMRDTAKDVHKRYSGEGTDHIVFLVHEDNWKSPGIWGTNYSNRYSGYQVQYARYDKDNMANSVGTLYHEIHHSHDALIMMMLGVDIQPILKVNDWDDDITHGGKYSGAVNDWKYIRHKENTKSLEIIAPYLRRAYGKREEIYQDKLHKMRTIVNLLGRLVQLYRVNLKGKKKY